MEINSLTYIKTTSTIQHGLIDEQKNILLRNIEDLVNAKFEINTQRVLYRLGSEGENNNRVTISDYEIKNQQHKYTYEFLKEGAETRFQKVIKMEENVKYIDLLINLGFRDKNAILELIKVWTLQKDTMQIEVDEKQLTISIFSQEEEDKKMESIEKTIMQIIRAIIPKN